MDEEWRLQVDLEDETHSLPLSEHLEASELEHDLSAEFHDRVIVSRDGSRLFLYAGTREQIDAAEAVLERLDQAHGWSATHTLTRWHPVAEEWEDPEAPLPEDDDERRAERRRAMAQERAETAERGAPEFEVRIDFPSRHEAVEFGDRLRSEGIPVVHRWRFLLVGAADQDSAGELAEQIRKEAPADSKIKVEGTWQIAFAERPPNPFAFLGGLAG